MTATHPEVALGPEGHTVDVPVIAQPHAYLLRQIEAYMARAEALEALGAIVEGADISEAIGLILTAGDDLLYDLAATLIPDLPTRMSKHQWAGYRTSEDYSAGNYRREDDHSPTVPQIKEAFTVASRVNHFDVFKVFWGPIKGMVGPKEKEDLKNWIRTQFGSVSLSSPGTSGKSPQPSSGETPPTSAPGEGKPAESETGGDTPDAGSGSPQPT